MSTFEERKAAVAEHHQGDLQPHTCCPGCGNPSPHVAAYDTEPVEHQSRKGVLTRARPAKDGDAARCNRCGWKGTHADLVDTVAAGHTKI